jgi:hypothetical protein
MLGVSSVARGNSCWRSATSPAASSSVPHRIEHHRYGGVGGDAVGHREHRVERRQHADLDGAHPPGRERAHDLLAHQWRRQRVHTEHRAVGLRRHRGYGTQRLRAELTQRGDVAHQPGPTARVRAADDQDRAHPPSAISARLP